jgi:hypothetical protein
MNSLFSYSTVVDLGNRNSIDMGSIQSVRNSFTRYHHALVPSLTGQFSMDPLRYPTFCVRFAASHKSFVRATGQLTRS